MKNNIYTAIPDWFNKVRSQSTDNTSTTTTQTTIIGGGGSISMSVHNLFIKSDTTITIDNFTISDLFVTDQITDTENWLTTPLLHTLPNTEVSVTTAAQLLYIGAYDKNNNQIKLYQFSEAISTVVIPENCYYLRASSNKTNTDLTIKYIGLNNFDETQLNKLESSSFQNFLTLVEGDEKGVITNSVLNLSLVFQNPLYYTLDKAGNVLISIDRDALFSQSENPTDDRYVTTVANSVQDILSSKNFKEGLSINGIEIVERNGFLYIKGNLATTGGITAYTDDPDDPGGSGGLPGGGAIGDIVITGSGNALVDASLSEDHSVITFTKGWLVDAESDQSITGIKDFINGIKLSGQLIKIVDGVLFLDCSIAATGGITAYATMPGEGGSSIMDQLVVDTEYFIITEEGVLTIVPGSVGGISNIYVTGNGNALTTVTLSEDGKTISFTKDKNFADQAEMSAYKSEVNQTIAEFKNEVNEQLKHFVTLDTEQEITAIKHFIEGITIGSNKHKFYEKDGVLWLEGDIAITGGITTYATENVDVSTIMDGVVVDEETITKGSDNVLRIKNAGAGSSFDENAMWSALASSSDKLINKSHLTTALTGYATETWVISNYATLSSLESVSTKLNDFLEGSDTDTIINKWKELEAFLSGMAETDNLAEILETKADKSYVDSTFVTIATKQTITGEKTFSATLNTAAIKASGNITAPSLEASDYITIAGIKFRKLENGAILVEGNLAATGGITGYAIDPVDVTTIMSGVVADETTITNDKGVLKIKNAGSGSGFDKSAMWEALKYDTVEQINKSHLTDALTGYATESWVTDKGYITSSALNGYATESWVTSKNYAVKSTTLAGYGITNAYTKTDADSRYVNVSGDTMTGNLSVKFSGRTDQINLFHSTTTNRGGLSLTDTDNTVHAFHLTTTNLLWKGRTVWDSGNDGSESGLDADLLDGTHKSGLLTALTSSSGTNISITVGGTTKSIADLYAYASTKLETARSLWGNNFDGTASISGTIQFTSNGEKWLLQTKRSDNTRINGIKTNGFQMCTYYGNTKTMQFGSDRILSYVDFRAEKDVYINGIRLHKTADGVITLEGNLAVTGGITAYSTGDGSGGSSGGGLDTDLLWELLAGSGDQQINKTHLTTALSGYATESWVASKNYLTSVSIATISDLHSSWDSVLATLKPNWLTSVSIATISDLHANWDALLKAAPSAYVTRWPTISEVTNKQNLVIKLNGGTTEGTNQFTYNATAAKSLNITPARIGSYTKSESDSKYPTKTGSGASGTWDIDINGTANDADKLDGYHEIDFFRARDYISYSVLENFVSRKSGTYNVGYDGYSGLLTVFYFGAGSVSAMEILAPYYDPSRGLQLRYAVDSNRFTSWRSFAFEDGNIASATKLETARNIWGVSFNGTKDVTGNITLGNHDIIGYNGARIIQNLSGNLGINPSENVGIGTTSPQYKLHVSGTIFSNSEVKCVRYVYDDITATGLSASDYFLSNQPVIRHANEMPSVAQGSCRPILRWGDAMSRIGYQTRYLIASVRDNGYDWGRIFMAVSNNDAGTSAGCTFSIYGSGYVEVTGNILSTGGITAYSSDIRAKNIIENIELSLKQISEAPTVRFKWNGWKLEDDGKTHIGGLALYTQKVLPEAILNTNDFLNMDYATTGYIFAVHTARHLLDYETKTDKEIRKLKNRIKYLEKQLKSLHYEEANIVDN